MTTSPLIDARTLAGRLADPGWVVVDCRFRLTQPEAGRALYEESHLPGARYAHLDHDLSTPPPPGTGRHPLPAADVFAATLGGWGISNSSTVVTYDDASGAVAARLWWMLRWVGHESALVLDGGIQAWEGAGLALERGNPVWGPAAFSVDGVREEWVVETGDIPNEIEQGAVLVDARSRDRFIGASEPIDPIAGHVPHAVNYPFSAALNSDGLMRDPGELKRELKRFTEHPRGLIAMCGSGVTACHLLLAAKAAGLGDGRAYIGSWSEWISDSSRPIATGEESSTAAP